MVMLHHYSQYVISHDISNAILYQLLSTQGGYLGVAIFFFLSGYGLMESESKSHLNLKTFFKRRFLKIYLPVLLISFIWMLASPFLLTKVPFSGFEIQIGGITLTISNILLDFGDEVLWFIKVLFILYAIFYIFSEIWIFNRVVGLIFIVLMTAAVTVYYKSISVPYFAIGVILSNYKSREIRILVTLWIALICYACLGFFFYETNVAGHSAINASLIGTFILAMSLRTWEIKVPSMLGVMSFDLYIVHNKVLCTLKQYNTEVSLWVFLFVTIFFTLSFCLFRTKVLKI